VTVVRYVDDSRHAAVEDTMGYVLSQWQGVLKRDREEFVRWWVGDEKRKCPRVSRRLSSARQADHVVLVNGNLADLLGDSLE
jgi:hypothetical protein